MRPILCAAVTVALTLGLSGPARSQVPSNILSAEQAVREALTANRDLQVAQSAIEAARGRRLQAGRLENPELALGYGDDFAFQSEGERTASVGFAQRLPITARLERARDVAAKDVAIAEAEVRDFARTLIADVESAFYSVRTLAERIDVQAQLVESVRKVEATTARRLKAAEVSPAELSLLRIERLRLEQESLRLVRERDVAIARLARLLGRSPIDVPTPVGALDPGAVEYASDPEGRPDFDAASRNVERADADRELALTEVWEDWTVGLGYDRERAVFDAPIGTQTDSFLRLGVSVPLPLWNRQQGRIASAQAELRRTRRAREALSLRIEEETQAARARVRTLRASVDAYANEILPEATRAQKLFERGYRQGLVGVAELLQAQRQYNESQAFYVELVGDLRQAAIDLEAATGRSPHLDPLASGGEMP